MKGEEHPASLTKEEIRRVCQLALVAIPKRVVLADFDVSERPEAMR